MIGFVTYAHDTWKGDTKPNRITWVLWTVAPLIAFFAQISEGVGIGALLSLTIGVGPLLVLAASFANKNSYWQISRFDLMCGAISILALILWLVTGTGIIAIVLSMVADFMASVPTLIKAYRNPETESSIAFLAGIIATIITIFSLSRWNFASVGFPVYLLLNGIVLFVLIRFPGLRPAYHQLQRSKS
jgi:hypothetical protein